MLKKVLIAVGCLIILASGIMAGRYHVWQTARMSSLEGGSELADTPNGQVEYRMTGSSGPVLLFLHGMPGGYDQAPEPWPGFRLLSLSRPGYLRTPQQVGLSPAEQADSYIGLLDSLDVDKVILLGVSGGGPSAISFAQKYPDRTQAMILMEAISQPLPNEGNIHWSMKSNFVYWLMLSAMLNFGGPEALVATQVSDPDLQTLILNSPEKLARLEKIVWSIWPPSERVQGWENDMKQVDHLVLPSEDVSIPTLIFHGTEDKIVPFRQSEVLATQIPNSQFHIVEGGNHSMLLTHAEEVREISLQFLAELE